jgi:cyclopropane fatty-acyl-phospholipid synthase-like methyltransferase
MLDVFRQWVTDQGASDIELKQADVLEIGELPPHWTAYDLIVSSTMLEYIPRTQVRGAVSNLMQLLRNGGILLAIITRRNLLTRWLAEKWWKTNLYGESEIQALFREAGFGTVEFKKLSPGWSNSIMVVEAQK